MGILAREVRHVPSWQRDGGEVPTPSRTVREPLAGRGSRCPAPTPLQQGCQKGWSSQAQQFHDSEMSPNPQNQ